MLSFLFVFYFLYIGLSISFNAYLYAFGLSNVPGMNLSKENSVYLNSVLYFSVVVGQFFAIFLSRKVSPTGTNLKQNYCTVDCSLNCYLLELLK